MKELETNIDYLTITSDSAEVIKMSVEEVLKSVPGLHREHDFHWMGYKGKAYVGDSGHLSYGIKPGHGLIQMSGTCSDAVMRNLEMLHLESLRCTRLDLAVTVCLPQPRQLVREVTKAWSVDDARKYSVILKNNTEGGTLYVGSRQSEQFGRLYDKGAEIRAKTMKDSLPDAILWRYEVEYKRHWAEAMRGALSDVIGDGRSLDYFIRQTVWQWFAAHGVSPEFNQSGEFTNIVSVATHVKTTQKTMDWLSIQVRPAIARVAEDRALREILLALGIETDGDLWLTRPEPARFWMQYGFWGVPPWSV